MAQMVISVAELTNKKGVLEELAATFKAKLDDFKETGDRLHSMWEGDAKETFVKSFKADTDNLRKVLNVIADFLIVLEKIISIYMMMEAKNIQTAGGRS